MVKKRSSSRKSTRRSSARVQPMRSSKPGVHAHLLGILGIICGVLSFLFPPLLFAAAGVVLGGLAIHQREKRLGLIAVIVSIVLGILGYILSYYILTT